MLRVRPTVPSLLALCALAVPAGAQVELAWSEGLLGANLAYTVDAPAGAPLAILVPSFETGPTPLALLDPTDPRTLDVGLDLFALATVTPLDPAGDASLSFALPAAPALAGRVLYSQAVTVPGAQTVVGGISNRVQFVLGFSGNSYPALGDDLLPRRWAQTVVLDDGSVLVAGGLVPGAPQTIAATDLVTRFDPQTQTYAPFPQTLPRAFGRARTTVLADGRTLIAGGLDANGVSSASLLFDPANGQFVATGPLQQARVFHTLSALPDGRAIAIGGSAAFTPGHPIGHPAATSQVLATTELFDPQTATWSPGPSLPVPTTMHEAVTLNTGRVLAVGGVARSTAMPLPTTTAAAYFFDPVTNALGSAPPLPQPRMHQGSTATELGNALVAGGANVDFANQVTTVHKEAWVFDAALAAWNRIPDAPGLIRCGQLTCVENGVKIYYLFGMGLSALDLATGATWEEPIGHCIGPRARTEYADISTACSDHRFLIRCE